MFTFVARLRVAAGQGEALEAVLAHVRDETHAHEPGVAYYDFAVSADDPSDYLVVEVYRDAATQAAHMRTAWVQASIPRTMALIESIDVRQYVTPGTSPVAMRVAGDLG